MHIYISLDENDSEKDNQFIIDNIDKITTITRCKCLTLPVEFVTKHCRVFAFEYGTTVDDEIILHYPEKYQVCHYELYKSFFKRRDILNLSQEVKDLIKLEQL